MKRTFKIVSDEQRTPQTLTTDWSLCFLCQKNTEAPLICPANSGRESNSYETLSKNLAEFSSLHALPPSLKLQRISDDDNNFVKTLISKKARFHKSCSLKYNNTELGRARKRLLPSNDDDGGNSSVGEKFTRSKTARVENIKVMCFFCGVGAQDFQRLHGVLQYDTDLRIRQCADILQDQELIGKLSLGDLMAQGAKYHLKCLSALYNRAARAKKSSKDLTSNQQSRFVGRAFAELIGFIKSLFEEENVAAVLRLRDVVNMYEDRIQALGGEPSRIHSSRLKDKILNYVPYLTTHTQGRDVVFVKSQDVGESLRRSCDQDAEMEAFILSRAANIIRRDLKNRESYSFEGKFPEGCQEESVPHSILTLLSMILHGTSIEEHAEVNQAVLTIGQLVAFNANQKHSATLRHSKRQETPLSIFVGSYIHAKTRSKEIIQTFYALGLSVSYDKVLAVSSSLGNSAIEHYHNLGVVCPRSLVKNVFTLSAVDNIDHNPSSTSAMSSFHGTGISLFQQVPSEIDQLHQDDNSVIEKSSGKKIQRLPDSYSTVLPVAVTKKTPAVPAIPGLKTLNREESPPQEEVDWCNAVNNFIRKSRNEISNEMGQITEEDKCLSWAAYHSKSLHGAENESCKSVLLPLFSEESKSVAMMRHAMGVIKAATNFLSPSQIPVMACDQPLYKLAKEIQWAFHQEFGEDTFVVMLGGLHITMALLKCLGTLLEGSGWSAALSQAGIASSGTAESFLVASHVKKTLRAHQITACALFSLRKKAYEESMNTNDEDNPQAVDENEWYQSRGEESAQFYFWQLILEIELHVLTFTRAIHSGNFDLYVQALSNLKWIFFSLDRPNYARVVSVHVRDMLSLVDRLPHVYSEFSKGNFVVRKTRRSFSGMSIDEAHEQNNAIVKGDGGAIGLTENPTALLRWMVAGPEVARIISEFNKTLNKTSRKDESTHHEISTAKQRSFVKNVESMISTMSEMGNPFLDTSSDLMVLDSRIVVDSATASELRTIKSIGESQAVEFFKTRLIDCSVPMDTTIKKNKFTVFNRLSARSLSRKEEQLVSVKEDRSLFSRLYIACQVRQGNLDVFFSHENHTYPPALSENGELRFGKKADLLACLKPDEDNTELQSLNFDMVVIDGAATVNYIRPDPGNTFADYGRKFVAYLNSPGFDKAQRIDVVFDEYLPASLKSALRLKRGKGARRKMEATKQVPKNWPDFLRNDLNKQELFEYLADFISTTNFKQKVVVVTRHTSVLCNVEYDLAGLMPCSHEEADGRMLLHAAHGASHGCSRIFIRTVDTDVIVLATAFLQDLQGCEQLWIGLGTGKSYRIFDIRTIAQRLGPEKCAGLLAFHAFTGCDTTSSFRNKGKRSAWAAWLALPAINDVFISLSQPLTPEEVLRIVPGLEKYVVILYDRCSEDDTVNAARKRLFSSKGRDIENIPPTQDALIQHALRTSLQAGHIWKKSLEVTPFLPDPQQYGWINSGECPVTWKVKWTSIPSAAEVCQEIIACACKTTCRNSRCGCGKAGLPCTSLCKCGGCENFGSR